MIQTKPLSHEKAALGLLTFLVLSTSPTPPGWPQTQDPPALASTRQLSPFLKAK
jgi:hypothetical protein